MTRIQLAARVLRELHVGSVLDVGCRQCELSDLLEPSISYAGADLYANGHARMRYVGDITALQIPEKFDAVVALDILEHLESPSTVFDKLADVSSRYVLVSFPNCYDLKSRFLFAVRGQLGGKYRFSDKEPEDRHRWLMNRKEVIGFYRSKASQHRMGLRIIDLTYGSSGRRTLEAMLGRAASRVLPKEFCSATVFGLFTHRADGAAHPFSPTREQAGNTSAQNGMDSGTLE